MAATRGDTDDGAVLCPTKLSDTGFYPLCASPRIGCCGRWKSGSHRSLSRSKRCLSCYGCSICHLSSEKSTSCCSTGHSSTKKKPRFTSSLASSSCSVSRARRTHERVVVRTKYTIAGAVNHSELRATHPTRSYDNYREPTSAASNAEERDSRHQSNSQNDRNLYQGDRSNKRAFTRNECLRSNRSRRQHASQYSSFHNFTPRRLICSDSSRCLSTSSCNSCSQGDKCRRGRYNSVCWASDTPASTCSVGSARCRCNKTGRTNPGCTCARGDYDGKLQCTDASASGVPHSAGISFCNATQPGSQLDCASVVSPDSKQKCDPVQAAALTPYWSTAETCQGHRWHWQLLYRCLSCSPLSRLARGGTVRQFSLLVAAVLASAALCNAEFTTRAFVTSVADFVKLAVSAAGDAPIFLLLLQMHFSWHLPLGALQTQKRGATAGYVRCMLYLMCCCWMLILHGQAIYFTPSRSVVVSTSVPPPASFSFLSDSASALLLAAEAAAGLPPSGATLSASHPSIANDFSSLDMHDSSEAVTAGRPRSKLPFYSLASVVSSDARLKPTSLHNPLKAGGDISAFVEHGQPPAEADMYPNLSSSPPSSPLENGRHLLGSSADGAYFGHSSNVRSYNESSNTASLPISNTDDSSSDKRNKKRVSEANEAVLRSGGSIESGSGTSEKSGRQHSSRAGFYSDTSAPIRNDAAGAGKLARSLFFGSLTSPEVFPGSAMAHSSQAPTTLKQASIVETAGPPQMTQLYVWRNADPTAAAAAAIAQVPKAASLETLAKTAVAAVEQLSWGSCSASCGGGRQDFDPDTALTVAAEVLMKNAGIASGTLEPSNTNAVEYMNEVYTAVANALVNLVGEAAAPTKTASTKIFGPLVKHALDKTDRTRTSTHGPQVRIRGCNEFPCSASDLRKLVANAAGPAGGTSKATLSSSPTIASAMVDGTCGLYLQLELLDRCRSELLLYEIGSEQWSQRLTTGSEYSSSTAAETIKAAQAPSTASAPTVAAAAKAASGENAGLAEDETVGAGGGAGPGTAGTTPQIKKKKALKVLRLTGLYKKKKPTEGQAAKEQKAGSRVYAPENVLPHGNTAFMQIRKREYDLPRSDHRGATEKETHAVVEASADGTFSSGKLSSFLDVGLRNPPTVASVQREAAGGDSAEKSSQEEMDENFAAETGQLDAATTAQLQNTMATLSFPACMKLCEYRNDCGAVIYFPQPGGGIAAEWEPLLGLLSGEPGDQLRNSEKPSSRRGLGNSDSTGILEVKTAALIESNESFEKLPQFFDGGHRTSSSGWRTSSGDASGSTTKRSSNNSNIHWENSFVDNSSGSSKLSHDTGLNSSSLAWSFQSSTARVHLEAGTRPKGALCQLIRATSPVSCFRHYSGWTLAPDTQQNEGKMSGTAAPDAAGERVEAASEAAAEGRKSFIATKGTWPPLCAPHIDWQLHRQHRRVLSLERLARNIKAHARHRGLQHFSPTSIIASRILEAEKELDAARQREESLLELRKLLAPWIALPGAAESRNYQETSSSSGEDNNSNPDINLVSPQNSPDGNSTRQEFLPASGNTQAAGAAEGISGILASTPEKGAGSALARDLGALAEESIRTRLVSVDMAAVAQWRGSVMLPLTSTCPVYQWTALRGVSCSKPLLVHSEVVPRNAKEAAELAAKELAAFTKVRSGRGETASSFGIPENDEIEEGEKVKSSQIAEPHAVPRQKRDSRSVHKMKKRSASSTGVKQQQIEHTRGVKAAGAAEGKQRVTNTSKNLSSSVKEAINTKVLMVPALSLKETSKDGGRFGSAAVAETKTGEGETAVARSSGSDAARAPAVESAPAWGVEKDAIANLNSRGHTGVEGADSTLAPAPSLPTHGTGRAHLSDEKSELEGQERPNERALRRTTGFTTEREGRDSNENSVTLSPPDSLAEVLARASEQLPVPHADPKRGSAQRRTPHLLAALPQVHAVDISSYESTHERDSDSSTSNGTNASISRLSATGAKGDGVNSHTGSTVSGGSDAGSTTATGKSDTSNSQTRGKNAGESSSRGFLFFRPPWRRGGDSSGTTDDAASENRPRGSGTTKSDIERSGGSNRTELNSAENRSRPSETGSMEDSDIDAQSMSSGSSSTQGTGVDTRHMSRKRSIPQNKRARSTGMLTWKDRGGTNKLEDNTRSSGSSNPHDDDDDADAPDQGGGNESHSSRRAGERSSDGSTIDDIIKSRFEAKDSSNRNSDSRSSEGLNSGKHGSLNVDDSEVKNRVLGKFTSGQSGWRYCYALLMERVVKQLRVATVQSMRSDSLIWQRTPDSQGYINQRGRGDRLVEKSFIGLLGVSNRGGGSSANHSSNKNSEDTKSTLPYGHETPGTRRQRNHSDAKSPWGSSERGHGTAFETRYEKETSGWMVVDNRVRSRLREGVSQVATAEDERLSKVRAKYLSGDTSLILFAEFDTVSLSCDIYALDISHASSAPPPPTSSFSPTSSSSSVFSSLSSTASTSPQGHRLPFSPPSHLISPFHTSVTSPSFPPSPPSFSSLASKSSAPTPLPLPLLLPDACVAYAASTLLLLPPAMDTSLKESFLKVVQKVRESESLEELEKIHEEEQEAAKLLPPHTCPSTCVLSLWSPWSSCGVHPPSSSDSKQERDGSLNSSEKAHTEDGTKQDVPAIWQVRVRGLLHPPYRGDTCLKSVDFRLCNGGSLNALLTSAPPDAAAVAAERAINSSSLREPAVSNAASGSREAADSPHATGNISQGLSPNPVAAVGKEAELQNSIPLSSTTDLEPSAFQSIAAGPPEISIDCVTTPYSVWSPCTCAPPQASAAVSPTESIHNSSQNTVEPGEKIALNNVHPPESTPPAKAEQKERSKPRLREKKPQLRRATSGIKHKPQASIKDRNTTTTSSSSNQGVPGSAVGQRFRTRIVLHNEVPLLGVPCNSMSLKETIPCFACNSIPSTLLQTAAQTARVDALDSSFAPRDLGIISGGKIVERRATSEPTVAVARTDDEAVSQAAGLREKGLESEKINATRSCKEQKSNVEGSSRVPLNAATAVDVYAGHTVDATFSDGGLKMASSGPEKKWKVSARRRKRLAGVLFAASAS